MGWRFRKSFKIGPVRASLGKRGVGLSWGFPGFRVGRTSDGRAYFSIGIPGTGISYVQHFGKPR